MTTLKELHNLIDQLPECEWSDARQFLLKHLAKHDPVLHAFLNAPEDDEPETDEERAAMEEVYADLREGRGYWISQEELEKKFRELP